MQKAMRALVRASLLAATAMTAMPALAQDRSVDERLDRLEALVEGLIERIDRQDGRITEQDAAIATETQRAITEARAVAARTEAVEEQMAEAEEESGLGFSVGGTRVSFGGYVKLDAVTQRTSGGQIPGGSILRDFLIPAAIPVGGPASGFDTDFNVRQTRFFFDTVTEVGDDHTLSSHIELDFQVTGGGDERISNSYAPRVRQAYISYDNWLLGQAWSTFQNVGALPDTLDFIGTTPGTVFVRQPLVRYTNGGLQIAVEQPETTVTAPDGSRVLPGDDTLPDIVARYNFNGLAIAGILRTLRVSDDDFGTGTDSAIGYGVSVSGRVPLGPRDDFRFMATVGDGLGRYIGLNIVNDAAITADGDLDPIFTYSGFAAFRHVWSDELRSSVAASYFRADNPVALTGLGVTDEVWNAMANLIYTPVAPLDIGIEYMYARRALESGQSGNLQRVQMSARYRF
ncbi:MAG: DcaP family trimeric outer membrane transporter [Parasphingopyxis sp.]|uniref:DcaP family trimeric outer membrane transporter n=1 Tax=Parasphingopyxis sp. TaxID=1920299 RepID=UPI003F9F397C